MEGSTSPLTGTVSMRRAHAMTGVPYNTIRRAVEKGSIPAWRVGKTTRVRPEDVAAMIQPVVPVPAAVEGGVA